MLYLNSTKLINQLVLLHTEFLQLGGQNGVRQIQATKLIVIVHLLFSISILFLFTVGLNRFLGFRFLLAGLHLKIVLRVAHSLI